jgi:hypothetical protein
MCTKWNMKVTTAMSDLVTVINPCTGKPVTMLRELAGMPGCWLSPGAPTDEEAAWMRENLDVKGFTRALVEAAKDTAAKASA